MTSIREDEKRLKPGMEIHDGKMYDDADISNIVKQLVETTEGIDSEKEECYELLSKFIYFSPKDKKYFFNSKRKNPKQRIYHKKILIALGIDSPTIDGDNKKDPVFIFQRNDETDDDFSEIMELDSEQLEIIEKKYIEKNKNAAECILSVCGQKRFYVQLRTDPTFGPFGTQWVHATQEDDPYTEIEHQRATQFDILRAIPLPPQGTDEWHAMRNNKITASSGATALMLNKYEIQFEYLLNKVIIPPFTSNKYCYHGKKYEDVATIIYEYRMNVLTDEFGLIEHPKYPFLGASPDRIATKYKLNGLHKSKYVGRMLEIKCPLTREIHMDGEIKDHICPIYYWVQVQLQLECCNLDECDFWQCDIREYKSRTEFIEDTHLDEPFRSKKTNFEKGCLIQLYPKSRIQEVIDGMYENVIYESAKFIYPGNIEMSPLDCDIWISKMMEEISTNTEYDDYVFDRVIYWRLMKSKNVTISRDRQWFADYLPTFEKFWNYVEFLRNRRNKASLDILQEYIKQKPSTENLKKFRKYDIIQELNADVMNIIHLLHEGKLDDVRALLMNIKVEKATKKPSTTIIGGVNTSEYLFDSD